MCLPRNMTYEIKGKYSSKEEKTFDIALATCTDEWDPRPCANQSDIDELFASNNGNLYFSLYFLNPLINPQSEDYLTYYLEDSNYITFSQDGG